MRIVALISAYNEGDVIYHVIGDLIANGIEVYLIDNNSTDNTVAEASKWLGRGLTHIERFPQDCGYPERSIHEYVWKDILQRKEELAQQLGADWYIHADADEFRESPWIDLTLGEAIKKVDTLGYNAIDFELLNFRPTDNNFVAGTDVRKSLHYYDGYEEFDAQQVKAWKNLKMPVSIVGSGGHNISFTCRQIFPVKFVLRHYPIRSQMHGLRKVFEERKKRFNKNEREDNWHVQYDDVQDTSYDFIKLKEQLVLYDQQIVKNELFKNDKNKIEVQIFFDDGKGIRTTNSVVDYLYINGDVQHISVDIPKTINVTNLRIDPHCDSVVVILDSIKVETPNQVVDLVSTGKMLNNAFAVEGNRYYFETDDPQFIFNGIEDIIPDGIRRIVFRAKFASIGKAALHECVDYLLTESRNYTDKDSTAQGHIRALTEHIGKQEKIIQDLLRVVDQQKQSSNRGTARKNLPSSRPLEIVPVISAQPGKIAIHLHLYYIDLADTLLAYFARMPFYYDLYITVVDPSQMPLVEQKARALCGAHLVNLNVIIVPNRGRDISALFVALKHVYTNYDYICHVHSKKSLYSGEERSDWCNYLFSSLFKDELHLTRIFGLFEANPKIGQIYPATFHEMPYWCHSWLSNHRSSHELFGRLKINLDTSQYIDYPVSSMLWARTNALQPLFDLDLTFDDFPAEPIPNDGTLCHAIERSLNIAGYMRGYTFAELDINEGRLTIGEGKKNLDQYWDRSIEHLWQTLEPFQAISLDIFDTLITRPLLMPDHAFLLMQRRIEQQFCLSIDFLAMRKQAENHVRQHLPQGADATIHAVYEVFGKITGLSPDAVNRIKQIEIDTEIHISMPRKGMFDLVRHLQRAGKRVVLVSDMYLTKEIIQRILEKNGLDTSGIDILVSSETGIRKDTGELWRHYLKYVAQCHVGDNEHSDIQLALDNGVPQYHVMSPLRLFELAQPRLLPRHGSLADSMYLGPVMARLFSSPFELHSSGGHLLIRNPKDLGYCIFGPVLLYFTTWLFSKSRELGIKQLLFLAREGYLLKQLYDMFAERFGDGGIESHYLLCSRRANSIPTIGNEDDILALLKENYSGSLANLLECRYGINLLSANEAKDIPDHILLKDYNLPQDRDLLVPYILKFKNVIFDQAKDEKEAYLGYASKIGISNDKKCAAVDIGFAGTIQKYLAKLTSADIAGFYLVTNQKALDNPCLDKIFGCFGEFVTLQNDNCIFSYSLILESLLTAQSGQLIRFDKNGAPVYSGSAHTEVTWPLIRATQLGVIEYFQDSMSWFGDALVSQLPKMEIATHFFKTMAVHAEIVSKSLRDVLKVDDYYVSNKIRNAIDYASPDDIGADVDGPSADLAYVTTALTERGIAEHLRFRSQREFSKHFELTKFAYEERLLVEKILSNRSIKSGKLTCGGYCDCCGKKTQMQSDWTFSDATLNHKAYVYNYEDYARWYGKVVLFREHLICSECGLNNRQRGIFHAVDVLGVQFSKSNIYAYEQVTPFFSKLSEKGHRIIGSEYLGPQHQRGQIYDGVRNEDATNLSFADETFDLLISNDVFEHVPDIGQAFREAHRVLAKGGKLLFSIPFDISVQLTTQRAKLNGGQIQHLLEPVYHGNPVSDKGSLVFYDFGWDIIDYCRSCGFYDAYMLYYYNTNNALIGGGLQFVFAAEK